MSDIDGTDEFDREFDAAFPVLRQTQLERFAERGEERFVPAGVTFIEAGTVNRQLFVVRSGRVDVSTAGATGGERILRSFGPGEFVGSHGSSFAGIENTVALPIPNVLGIRRVTMAKSRGR